MSAALAALIRAHQPCVVLTGAGVSTESGIPDFRSLTGIWADFDPREYATAGAFRRDPEKVWRFYAPRLALLTNAEPNRAHLALADLERLGLVRAIVTQNIDLLHARAGSRDVIEVHGSIRTSTCPGCGARYALQEVVALLEGEGAPRCTRCARVLKPDVVFFDELLPEEAIDRAFALAREARLLLVVGSSLEVWPVAGVPLETLEAGGAVAIVNDGATPLDDRAALVVPGRAGDVLADVVERVRPEEGHRLRVVRYDPVWPRLYAEEAVRVTAAFGENAVEIEHMGSTAVPGLAAKPVIDVSVGLRSLELGRDALEAMDRLGYEYMGEYGIPGRLFFRKGRAERTHHVHAVEWGGEQWHRHRAFREYLLAHPDEARLYGEHKLRVAAEAASSAEYWERKQPYVDGLFARAWAWYGRAR